MTNDVSPPGSDEAIEIGCSCPVLDNRYGRGRFGDGEMYIIDDECEVHENGE